MFRQDFKNEARYYILHLQDLEELKQLTRQSFKQVHDRHWQIECFHRVIKQVCNIERFQVRDTQAIHNHFFCSLRAFAKLQMMRVDGLIDNLYQVSRQLFIPVIRQFILENLTQSLSAWLHVSLFLSMRKSYNNLIALKEAIANAIKNSKTAW